MPTLDAVSRRTIGLTVGLVLAAGVLGVPIGVHGAAANCKLTLQSGQASPASGTTETTTAFSVRVSWKAGCDDHRVVWEGEAHADSVGRPGEADVNRT